MSNGSLVPFVASLWITSSSSGSALCIVFSRRMLAITETGALICRSTKTLRNSDERSLRQKVRWSKFAKSVVCAMITNAPSFVLTLPCRPGEFSHLTTYWPSLMRPPGTVSTFF